MPPFGVVLQFAQTSDGRIWAATLLGGLIEINTGVKGLNVRKSKGNGGQSVPTSRVISDSQDRIWTISERAGVNLYDPKKNTTVAFRHSPDNLSSLASDDAYDIYQDMEGKIWVGTYEGLNLYRPSSQSFNRYTRQNTDLPSDRIYDIYPVNPV